MILSKGSMYVPLKKKKKDFSGWYFMLGFTEFNVRVFLLSSAGQADVLHL